MQAFYHHLKRLCSTPNPYDHEECLFEGLFQYPKDAQFYQHFLRQAEGRLVQRLMNRRNHCALEKYNSQPRLPHPKASQTYRNYPLLEVFR
jgi:hypothetical protein